MVTVCEGRPVEKRAENEEAIYGFLSLLGVSYLRADHPPAMTMDACAEIDAALGCEMCKNLFLTDRQGEHFYLLMVPGGKRFKTKELSPQLGCARLSFASEEQLRTVLHCEPGCASVLDLLFDGDRRVRLLVDEELKAWETVGCHPGQNTSSVALKTTDLFGKILPALGREATYVCLHGE